MKRSNANILSRNMSNHESCLHPLNPGYFDESDLAEFGFKSIGSNVRIAKTCTVVGLENIAIGSNVRIDGYCTISAAGEGFLTLGSFIHIGSHCSLVAGLGIRLEDFSGLSQGVRIYSKSDDYSGRHLTNPTIPTMFTGETGGLVTLERHVIIGAGSIVLPKVRIAEGSAVGALSLVTKSLDPWGIYFGSPAKRVKTRSKKLLELEQQLAEGLYPS